MRQRVGQAPWIDPYRRAASYVDRILRARNRVTCRCSGRQNSANGMVRPCSCPLWNPNDNATEVFPMSSEIAKKCVAELIGTFWLTVCRTAVSGFHIGRFQKNQAPNKESHLTRPTQELLGSALRCFDVSRLPPSRPHMADSRPSHIDLFRHRHARPCSYSTGHAARPGNLGRNGRVCQTCFYPLYSIGAGRGKPPRARAPEVGQTATDRKRDCRQRN